MKYKDAETYAAIAIVGCIVVGAGTDYARTVYRERQKRKKIESWKNMNLACIDNFRDRMLELLRDPRVTHAQFAKAWNEEQQFLDIVQHQPKY